MADAFCIAILNAPPPPHTPLVHAGLQVDSSCYAIPSPATVAKWVARVRSPLFKFHFKAFGLLCASSVPCNTLPAAAREALGDRAADPQARVALKALGAPVQDLVWHAYNAMLQPAVKVGRLAQEACRDDPQPRL